MNGVNGRAVLIALVAFFVVMAVVAALTKSIWIGIAVGGLTNGFVFAAISKADARS